MQDKQQQCIHLLYGSLVGQCECTTQPKGSFWCHYWYKGFSIINDVIKIFALVLPSIFIQACGRVKAAVEPQEWSKLDLNIGNFNRISRSMRYGKLNCIKFYSYCLQLTYAPIWPLAATRRVLSVNKVCPSFCLEVFFELALHFFLERGVVHDRARFFGNSIFSPRIGKNRSSLGFCESIGKFSWSFHNLDYNDSLY